MKNKKNYLDFVPVKNQAFKWEMTEDGAVIIYRTNEKWAERVTQVLLKRPKVTKIQLEEYGTFIWPLIDGNRSIYDIALLVKAQFGQRAEPVYDRLTEYFRSMDMQRLIFFLLE